MTPSEGSTLCDLFAARRANRGRRRRNSRIVLVRLAFRSRPDKRWTGFHQMLESDPALLCAFTAAQRKPILRRGETVLVFVGTRGSYGVLRGAFVNLGEIPIREYYPKFGRDYSKFKLFTRNRGIPDGHDDEKIFYDLVPARDYQDLVGDLTVEWVGANRRYQRVLDLPFQIGTSRNASAERPSMANAGSLMPVPVPVPEPTWLWI